MPSDADVLAKASDVFAARINGPRELTEKIHGASARMSIVRSASVWLEKGAFDPLLRAEAHLWSTTAPSQVMRAL